MNLRRILTLLALAPIAWGCGSSAPTGRTMPMEGVVQLPTTKNGAVATYRCSIDLASGKVEVTPGKRSGPDVEAAWNKMSPRLSKGERVYQVVFEENEKDAKGTAQDWALVTVIESDAAGKVLRKLPVQEFWGAFDSHAQRALLLKDGRFQFFVQFWAAGGKP